MMAAENDGTTLIDYKKTLYGANIPNEQMWYLLQDDLQKILIIGFAKKILLARHKQGRETTVQRKLISTRTELETAVVNKYSKYKESDWGALTLRQAIALHQWLRKNTIPNNVWRVIQKLDVSLLAKTDEPTRAQLDAYKTACNAEASKFASSLMAAERSDDSALHSVLTNFAKQPELALRIRFA